VVKSRKPFFIPGKFNEENFCFVYSLIVSFRIGVRSRFPAINSRKADARTSRKCGEIKGVLPGEFKEQAREAVLTIKFNPAAAKNRQQSISN
jgi:hypothetical protein